VEQPAGPGLALSTRQAIQVGVATSLAIIGGELLSPSRWYWAVIAAFVVFAGTTSRGDVLTRGRDRVLGTIGGVVAGMALAFVVNGAVVPSLVLLFVCLFLAIYLVRVSPGLQAFWITAVLALVYGLTGQFSVETLVLRVEETAVGAALGMLAGFLVLPTGTRAAFGQALDAMVDAVHAVLDTAVDRLLGRPVAAAPVELARDMDAALVVLRQRGRPLDSPFPSRRGRSSYARALRVFGSVDHYARLLARLSDTVRAPDWAETLSPAVARIRTNVDGCARLENRRPRVLSAGPEVDAAEARRPGAPPGLRGSAGGRAPATPWTRSVVMRPPRNRPSRSPLPQGSADHRPPPGECRLASQALSTLRRVPAPCEAHTEPCEAGLEPGSRHPRCAAERLNPHAGGGALEARRHDDVLGHEVWIAAAGEQRLVNPAAGSAARWRPACPPQPPHGTPAIITALAPQREP
jgi:hypothetical protein